jgi:CheY-like chemotaxis protein
VRLIEEVIKRRGDATLVAATHGRHALELARSVQPDVILLDLNLPDMHGSVVLQALRSDEITEAIPVIVVSADATGSQHRAVLAAGASAYLTKPIHIPELQVTLDRLLAPPSEAGGDRP